jgi:UPF0755 protein
LDRYGRQSRRRYRNPDDLEERLEALKKSNSGRPRRRKKGRSPLVPLLLVALLVVGGVYLVSQAFGGSEEPVAGGEGETARVVIEEGDSLSSISDKLKEAGVISNATLFSLEARWKGAATELRPGEYELARNADTDEVIETLSTGQPVETFTVTIPEGLTMEQTAEVVGQETPVSEQEFLEAARQTDYGYAFLEDAPNTEGFLFPKTYEFEEGTTARQMVNRFLEQYMIETEGLDFESAQQRLNLTEYELITVAAMVERESFNDAERPLVASVIYNRIREGMPLQIDATIQYALDEPRELLSIEDTRIDSPYNTYQNRGLPPGPIASPSRGAIEAALNPADTNYLYYVIRPGGQEHFFTDDYDEFLQAKAEAGL